VEMDIEIQTVQKVAVKYLRAKCGVRYWEDATVNGVADDDGTLIPCREGDAWAPTIDLETGVIEGWPSGTVASVHYKVCDDGRYALLDADRGEVVVRDNYVPDIMCPEGEGYGDYVIMEIDGEGRIAKWRADLSGFAADPT
jgi:hypothetical protein